uniref:hemicentin-1-like isoform X1 n=1 Tax=Styela clava TaxID=7725 RepID=UPI001939E123|nr:hemicentin-1-like isoform X1 [Styela clava]
MRRINCSSRRRTCLIYQRTFLLTLLELCILLDATFGKKYLKGQNATLTCDTNSLSSRSSDGPAAYVWFKHGEGDEEISVATSLSGVSQISDPLIGRAEFRPPILIIRDLMVTDSAIYSCQVIKGSAQSSTTKLEVNAVPTVNVEVAAFPTVDKDTGLYAAAVCQASGGKPPARIRWIYTNTGETQDSDEILEAVGDGTYTIKSRLRLTPGLLGRAPNSTDPVTLDDSRKNFTCVVSHDHFDDENERRVTVPINLLHPPVVTISVKSNKLTCKASGNPVPVVIWTRPDGSTVIGNPTIFVDQSTPTKSSGRYVCLARSSIAPDAVAAIDVQKSRDLPTLFTNTLRYNASLPVKAKGYEMECSAELEALTDVAIHRVYFVWSKDGKIIEERLSPYSIRQSTVAVSHEKSVVTSVLRMIEVERPRDEGLFKCRLSLPAIGTGYVRALERSIHINIDYPPAHGTVVTSVHPQATIGEHSDVTLSCEAQSSPPSSYRWFFNGKPKSSGSQLVLRNTSRHEAGIYKCVAFNYVPGSATKEVKLIVNYPPGLVHISKHGKYLKCSTEGGSVPPPRYTWLLPNGTVDDRGNSMLEISTFEVTVPTSYICLVTNGLRKTSNATYSLTPLKTGGIGSLTIGEFVVTVVVIILLIIILIAVIGWVVKKRECNSSSGIKKTKDTKTSTLLHYTEHPYGGGSLAGNPVPTNVFNRRLSEDTKIDFAESYESPYRRDSAETAKYDASVPMPNGKSTIMSPQTMGKPSLVNYVTLTSRSNLATQKENDKEQNSKYKSVEMLDGSGVEILENASIESANKTNKMSSGQVGILTNSLARLTTFSQPPSGFADRPILGSNYNTTRNPPREKQVQIGMIRALSENFNPVLFDDTVRPEKHDTDSSEATSGRDDSAATTNTVLPPSYSAMPDRGRIMSPHPAMSTPILPGPVRNVRNGCENDDYSSDSSSSSSTNRRTSSEHTQTPISQGGNVASNPGCVLYPGYRYNAVSHEPSPTYAFRPSPVPSRCQSVDPTYDLERTPPMPEIPTRNYLYQPYLEARFGVPLANQQSSLPTAVGMPYDSGSESTKSSNMVNNGSRRMQSLTLV